MCLREKGERVEVSTSKYKLNYVFNRSPLNQLNFENKEIKGKAYLPMTFLAAISMSSAFSVFLPACIA